MEFDGKKHIVIGVQRALGLVADGIAGKATWAAIGQKLGGGNNIVGVQAALGLVADGIDGPTTWKAISTKIRAQAQIGDIVIPSSQPTAGISANAYKLILKYEVGGGRSYYNKALKHPCYPGGASGVTIGIGYDMGYNTAAQFATDWKGVLPASDYHRLVPHLGKKRGNAKAAIASVKDISVSWEAAEVVFKRNTLPRFIAETIRAFPGAEKLHPDAFGALVSLVFNRGGSISGRSRSEMLNIRKALASGHDDIYNYIAKQIVDMKRLWVGKGLDGLLTRRDEEAKLVKSCA
jgi:GH24 family phage-related lysozyme (muramidase)